MGQKLVSNRNMTVIGSSGSALKFIKGEPVHVPDQALEECMRAGAIPADDTALPKTKTDVEQAPVPVGAERKQRILDAVEQMVLLNERGTFNANGAPKIKDLEKITEFVVDTREVDVIWHEYDAARKKDTRVDVGEVVTVKDTEATVIVEEAEEATKVVSKKKTAKKSTKKGE